MDENPPTQTVRNILEIFLNIHRGSSKTMFEKEALWL